MQDSETELDPIEFVFQYTRHGWARASISNGTDTYTVEPSYVPTDPLFVLLRALVELLRYGGDTSCEWFYEPAADRWMLHREDDTLQVTIRGVGDGFSRPNWTCDAADLRFSAVFDLWKFAAKVRLAASRMLPDTEAYNDPAAVRTTGEYRALCECLDEHKRLQAPSRDKPKRR